MNIPSAVFAFVAALLLGSLFHLIVDGGPRRLILYLILSTAGFGLGQWLAATQGWLFLPVGPLQLGPCVLGSLLTLLLGHWLSQVEGKTASRRGRL